VAFTGKLIGALIGSVAGPFGTLFGGLIGHFFDRAIEERRAQGALTGEWAASGDPVSQAQVNFLTCLIGLSLSVAGAGGRVLPSHVAAIKEFLSRSIPYAAEDSALIRGLVEEMYANTDRLDVAGMCAYYRTVSTPEGRLLLLRLLYQIAAADGQGVSSQEAGMIQSIAALLDVAAADLRRIRAEFVREAGRAFEILGVSPDATAEEITQAYRRLLMENHPDRVASLGPEFVHVAEEKFKTIQEAYEEIRQVKGF
jgi:DnaJ like chaperone protein